MTDRTETYLEGLSCVIRGWDQERVYRLNLAHRLIREHNDRLGVVYENKLHEETEQYLEGGPEGPEAAP